MLFYQQTPAEVLVAQKSSRHGLSKGEAAKRLQRDGSNTIVVKGESWWRKLVAPFADVMVGVLVVAAIIGWWQGEYLDTVIVLVVIFINAVIEWGQRFSTERILRALQKQDKETVSVYRDGAVGTLDAAGLVAGDVIVLHEGQKIPADARVLEVNNLYCDEAVLTGESSSVRKRAGVLKGVKEIYEQKNMVFSGGFVVAGEGVAVVVATGNQTVFGKLAFLATQKPLQSPMQKKVDKLVKQMVGVTFILAIVAFSLALTRGIELGEALRFVIAFAVSAVPEGLPVAITVVLALGMRRLAKEKALVRSMKAIENIGAVTTIATDKTGTLTKNQLQVQRVWAYRCSEKTLAKQINLTINHPSHQIMRDPLDKALDIYLKHRERQKSLSLQLQKSLPFEYKHALSGNVWKQAGRLWAYLKGAPEKILTRTDLSVMERKVVEQHFHALAKMGFRVIGLARARLNKVVTKLSRLPKSEWQFLGLVAIADGLRAGAGKAVRQAEQAGVKVKMITGDHEETAWQIAGEIGLSQDRSQVYNGRNLAKLKGEQLGQAVAEAKVFSRVLPEVKYKILAELNKTEITAMTGDGVNDVPALSRAHVGIAMGSGAAIAKEASDIILLDDNFRTIVKALKEGRIIIANIVKMLVYLFSTNGGEILVMLGALLLGMPLPLVAVQILWINLITDTCLVIPLGLEPGEKDVMRKPPAKVEAPILSKYMLTRVLLMAGGMGVTTLVLFKIFLERYDLAEAQTLVFIALIAMQLISAVGMRSDLQPIWAHSWRKNKKFAVVMMLTIILQLLVFVTPMREALHLVPVTREELGLVLGVSIGVMILLLEGHKWWGRKFMIDHKLLDHQ